MDKSALAAWLDAYGEAWKNRDPDAIAKLYTEDAAYYETPYDEPMRGLAAIREYASRAKAAQRDVEFWHQPHCAGDVGIARWGASFVRVPSGVKVELDGVVFVRLDEDNRCYEFREWWHRRES